MRAWIGLSLACVVGALPVGASYAISLGYSDETTVVEPGTDACASGVLVHDHDGSFENGYGWDRGGVLPPYYGAFGEAYDLGAGTVVCGVYWLTALPGWGPELPSDCYLWEGGISEPPSAVLGLVSTVSFDHILLWPSYGENDVEMDMPVSGQFTIGYWGDWPGYGPPEYYCGADVDGPPGHPWTCIAPGIGYPSGWQDPSIVWGPTSAMGCGVYFEQGTPAESATWGAVKDLFR